MLICIDRRLFSLILSFQGLRVRHLTWQFRAGESLSSWLRLRSVKNCQDSKYNSKHGCRQRFQHEISTQGGKKVNEAGKLRIHYTSCTFPCLFITRVPVSTPQHTRFVSFIIHMSDTVGCSVPRLRKLNGPTGYGYVLWRVRTSVFFFFFSFFFPFAMFWIWLVFSQI